MAAADRRLPASYYNDAGELELAEHCCSEGRLTSGAERTIICDRRNGPCIAQQYWTVSGLGGKGVSCGRFVGQSGPSALACRPLLAPLVLTSKTSPLHHHRKPLLPSGGPKLPWVLNFSSSGSLRSLRPRHAVPAKQSSACSSSWCQQIDNDNRKRTAPTHPTHPLPILPTASAARAAPGECRPKVLAKCLCRHLPGQETGQLIRKNKYRATKHHSTRRGKMCGISENAVAWYRVAVAKRDGH